MVVIWVLGGMGFLKDGTIIVGEEAFAEGLDQVGAAVFHEWLKQYRGDLTHEQIWQLEELWREWYDSQQ